MSPRQGGIEILPPGLSAELVTRRPGVSALTGLRFVAAFSVLIAHLFIYFSTPVWSDLFPYFVPAFAGFGMTLFFVLSGFVIHYNYSDMVSSLKLAGLAKFIWARFSRLYPIFIIALSTHLLIYLYSEYPLGYFRISHDVTFGIPYYLLLIQSWFYIPLSNSTLLHIMGENISITWSISTEWFFYFLYPAISMIIVRMKSLKIAILAILFWIILWSAFAFSLFSFWTYMDSFAVSKFGEIASFKGPAKGYSFVLWVLYYSPYIRVGEFILGCLTAHLYLKIRENPLSKIEYQWGFLATASAVISIPILIYFSYSPKNSINILSSLSFNFCLAPSCATLIFTLARYKGPLASLLDNNFVVALGESSYSIYVFHIFIITTLVGFFGELPFHPKHSELYALGKSLLATSLIFALSLALSACVEMPARKYLRGVWGRRRPGSQPHHPKGI